MLRIEDVDRHRGAAGFPLPQQLRDEKILPIVCRTPEEQVVEPAMRNKCDPFDRPFNVAGRLSRSYSLALYSKSFSRRDAREEEGALENLLIFRLQYQHNRHTYCIAPAG